jgi:prolyl-tRNA synthetase
VTQFLDVDASRCVKTLLVQTVEGCAHDAVALVVRGDHELNAIKAQGLADVATPLALAPAATVRAIAGCEPGYIGPVGLDCPLFVDHAAAHLADFVCGANDNDRHHLNVNWTRDTGPIQTADLRNVVAGDPSPDGRGTLALARGIEVGHIFQLGRKYAEAMNATVLDASGRSVAMTMGCYGIGVTRIVAAAIEQHHDDKGIVWPAPIAPFQVAIVPLNLHKSERVRTAADALYARLQDLGIETLLDDRDARPGFKFADMELFGIPHRLVINERGLDAGTVEYKGRLDSDAQDVPTGDLDAFLQARLADA